MTALAQTQPNLDPAESRSEQQLADAHRMEAIGRLVSGVAHDFNNLLTGIVLCADLLLAGLEEGSPLRRYAKEIRTASGQSAGMIRQLLDLARPRANEGTLLSINDAIAGLRNLLTRLIAENIELVTDLADDLRTVRIDGAQIQQVILNLVLNARDAMPEGGRITLTTRNCDTGLGTDAPEFVQFEVHDNGCGMDAQTCARVFEPFFTTKQPGRSTGLGLTTVYSIVNTRGGTVEIKSHSGKGTRVIVRLPATGAETNSPRPELLDPDSNRCASSKEEAPEANPEAMRTCL